VPPIVSCHDPIPDGSTRVSPKVRIDLDISLEEWPDLIELLKDFAIANDWAFRDSSETRPGVVKTLYLSLCKQNSLAIRVSEQRWATNAFEPFIPGRGTGVRIFGEVPEEVRREVAVKLVGLLEARWPHDVRFLDEDGRVVDRSVYLGA
jgi:hypothetical protein